MRIAHLTSVHIRYDTRIFIKQCQSLVNNGFDVNLVVADGKGDEIKAGITMLDVGKPKNRISRMLKYTWRVYRKAMDIKADVYHLHDPELIPIGLLLKKRGKIVIFDSHEDFPSQLIDKPYLNRIFQWVFSSLFSIFERISCSKFNAIVAATPIIRDKFVSINQMVVDINNYPIINELSNDEADWSKKMKQVCYIGSLTSIRGISKLVQASLLLKSSCNISVAGTFSEEEYERRIRSLAGWSKIEYAGYVNRDEVRVMLQNSMAGIVTFLPSPNHIDAQPNKMFEYMSAGIPVIASDFPLWRSLIEGNHCGICVNPLNPKEIAEAIDYLVLHPENAKEMGHRGREAIRNQYNWEREEEKLIRLYRMLVKESSSSRSKPLP